nr:phospholipase D family protein [Ruegeria atlantica]
MQNTTKEGLQALLDLEVHGVSETYVYHNEAGSVFHPKLYLFRNEEEARLIVGSNNLTAAGLYANVEAGLQLDTALTDDVVTDAMNALESWRDTSTKLAFRLDSAFLQALFEEGYVRDEAATRPPRRRPRGEENATKLFGSRVFTPPPRPVSTPTVTAATSTPAPTASPTHAASAGTTVLMRLRKARGTQTQIPFRVAETFFKDITSVESVQSGIVHGLNPAQAHGNRNTIKLEIPELRDHTDTFARFEKARSGVVYEVHDVGTPKGDQIKASLEEGIATGVTQTSISDVARATWWRYI